LEDTPLSVLFAALLFLILLSAFFSGSETGLMTLNRYRLRHLAVKQHPGAMRAQILLQRQDRLIGLILLGNNFVNVLASILMTLITLRLYNDTGLLFAAGLVLTIVILLFAEVTPKTLAALHPERVAFPAAFVYTPLLKLLWPVVWVVNGIANGLAKFTVGHSGSQHILSGLPTGQHMSMAFAEAFVGFTDHATATKTTMVMLILPQRCKWNGLTGPHRDGRQLVAAACQANTMATLLSHGHHVHVLKLFPRRTHFHRFGCQQQ